MNSQLASRAIEGVRAERARVLSEFQHDYPDPDEDTSDQWKAYFEDDFLPFEAELCLAVLVAINHQVERELVQLAARAEPDGRDQAWQENRALVNREEGKLRRKAAWDLLYKKLHIDRASSDWRAFNLLRLLANSHKHNAWGEPSTALCEVLGLADPGEFPYGTLVRSSALRGAIINFLGLPKEATYCDIADAFLACTDHFLAEVKESNPTLSAVQGHPKAFHPYRQWPR